MTHLYDLQNVCFGVSGSLLLSELTMRLPAGRVIGLIGHNGSGKSTLLKLLARQNAPTAGRIDFLGTDLTGWRGRRLAQKLGYLPQALPPAEGLLVRELTALGRYPWHGALGRPGARDRDAVATALAECGLMPLADRRLDTLSGGEAQRSWLSMLVAQEAGCLLLDEPISALDIAHQIEVLGLIRRLSRQKGRSVVMVLHDVNMAARFCDHVVALRGGRLQFEGPPSALMTPECLKAVFSADMEIMRRADGTPAAFPL